jgi:hypothetical protein
MLKAWLSMQQHSEAGLLGSDWTMTLSMGEPKDGFIV